MVCTMETYSHLNLEWCRKNFLEKPNAKSAHWFLQALLRHANAGKITTDELTQGLEEIKLWQKSRK